jgi:hypothetical protein
MIYFSLHRVKPMIAVGLNVASAPSLSFIPFDRPCRLHFLLIERTVGLERWSVEPN